MLPFPLIVSEREWWLLAISEVATSIIFGEEERADAVDMIEDLPRLSCFMK